MQKHVVQVKQRMEKGFTPLMKPLPMIVLAAVIGLFLFSFSSGFVFDTLEAILALFGATGGELAMAKVSTEALAFATSCTAFDGPGTTTITVWDGEGENEQMIREREIPADCPDDGTTFGTQTAGIGGLTGMVTGIQPVTVYCPGDGDEEECYVNGYYLPQPDPPGQDCGVNPECWIEWWIPGYGDPNIMVYHEKFPEEMQPVFTTTEWDTILLTAAVVGVMSLALDATVIGRAALGAGTRQVGDAAIGSRFGRFLSGGGASTRFARFGYRAGMGVGYAEASLRRILDGAMAVVTTSRGEIRDRMGRIAAGAEDYNARDFGEYLLRNKRGGVSDATVRQHARHLTGKAYASASSAVSLSKRQVDETLEGIARASPAARAEAAETARKQWTSSMADGELMLSRMSPATREALRGRLKNSVPVSRIQSLANKEVGGVALRDMAARICRTGCDEATGEHLEAFARAHVRSAGLPVGNERALLSGNRKWITMAAVGSALGGYMMDSNLGKYYPCAGNAYCVDQPFQETRWRVEMAPEAELYWKAIRSPAYLEARGDHHTRAYFASPCKADIKVGDSTTYCKASQFYDATGAWFSVTEPSVKLPAYDGEYTPQAGRNGAGFNVLGGGDAATHVLRYDVGACSAYTRQMLEEGYVDAGGTLSPDGGIPGGGEAGADLGRPINMDDDVAAQCAEQDQTQGTGDQCLDRAAVATCSRLPQNIAPMYGSRITEHDVPVRHCGTHDMGNLLGDTSGHGEGGIYALPCVTSTTEYVPYLSFKDGCSSMTDFFPDADVDAYSEERCGTMLTRAVRSGDIWVSHMQAGDFLADRRPFFRTEEIEGAEPFGAALSDEAGIRDGENGRIQFAIPASEWSGASGEEKLNALEDKLEELSQAVKEEAWNRCRGGEWSDATGFRGCGAMTRAEFMERTAVEWPNPDSVNVAGDDTYMVCGTGYANDDWVPSWMGGGDEEDVSSLLLEPGAYDPENDEFNFNADKSPFHDKYSDVRPNFCWENNKEDADLAELAIAALDIIIVIGSGAAIILSGGTLAPAAAVGVGAVSGTASVVGMGYYNNQDKWPD